MNPFADEVDHRGGDEGDEDVRGHKRTPLNRTELIRCHSSRSAEAGVILGQIQSNLYNQTKERKKVLGISRNTNPRNGYRNKRGRAINISIKQHVRVKVARGGKGRGLKGHDFAEKKRFRKERGKKLRRLQLGNA